MTFIERIGSLSDNEAGPRYLRLQKLLRQAVHSERLPLGAALPSERDLCEEYGLSRVTIRKAVEAELLAVAAGDPGLFIERRAFVADGRALEVTYTYYRGDAYDLIAELGSLYEGA